MEMNEEGVDKEVFEQIQIKDTRFKRLSTKIDGLFLALYDDLNLYYHWENEDRNTQGLLNRNGNTDPHSLIDYLIADYKYTGKLWLQRGILGERLCRKRFAEKAYRTCIEKGFSLYAWYRLLCIYADTFNPKACLVCVAEIIDQAMDDGIRQFSKVKLLLIQPFSFLGGLRMN